MEHLIATMRPRPWPEQNLRPWMRGVEQSPRTMLNRPASLPAPVASVPVDVPVLSETDLPVLSEKIPGLREVPVEISQAEAGIRVKLTQEKIDDVNGEVTMNLIVAMCLRDDTKRPNDAAGLPHFTTLSTLDESVMPHLEIKHTVNVEVSDELLVKSNRTGIIYVIRHYQVTTRDVFFFSSFPSTVRSTPSKS